MYREGNVSSLQLSTDFLLKYDRKLGAGFDMKLNFGGSIINRMFLQKRPKRPSSSNNPAFTRWQTP